MAFYSDRLNTSMCIALEEEGDPICGKSGRSCHNKIEDSDIETVWDLFIEDRIYDQCDCEQRLAEHLGIPEDEDNAAFARRQRRRAGLGAPEGGDD